MCLWPGLHGDLFCYHMVCSFNFCLSILQNAIEQCERCFHSNKPSDGNCANHPEEVGLLPKDEGPEDVTHVAVAVCLGELFNSHFYNAHICNRSRVPTQTFSVPGFFLLATPTISSLSSRTHHREVWEAFQRSVDELRAAQKSTASAGGLSEPL